jgi:acyl-CoA reductase-like NAD-dependent aldehyde dehydrogenase
MLFQLLIDGTLQAGASTIDVINPATGQVLAVAPRADSVQAERAVAAANRAFPNWSALSYAERRTYLEKLLRCAGSGAQAASRHSQ